MTFLFLDSNDDEFGAVAETVLSTLKSSGVKVYATLTWNTIYHHGYMKNPFDELVEKTYMDTRSEYILSIGIYGESPRTLFGCANGWNQASCVTREQAELATTIQYFPYTMHGMSVSISSQTHCLCCV